MINTQSYIQNLINPCAITQKKRVQAFIQSDASSYFPRQEIRFTLPTEIVDLTEAYVDAIIELTNQIEEVPAIYNLRRDNSAAVPTSGFLSFSFRAVATDPLPFNSTAVQIQTALNSLSSLIARGITAAVAGTTIAANDIVITLSGFNTWAESVHDLGNLVVVNQSMYTGTNAAIIYALEIVQESVLPTPRLEMFSPIIEKVRVEVNNLVIYDSSAMRGPLDAIVALLNTNGSIFCQYTQGAYNENGYFKSGQFRVQINISDIQILKSVLPLEIFPQHMVRIYFTLQSPNFCLIQAVNGNNQSYSVINPRLHYYRLSLQDHEYKLLMEKSMSDGVIVPFRNINSFQFNLPIASSNQDIIFNPNCQALLGIFFIMIPQDYLNDSTNIRKLSTFLRNNIFSYRIKIGSQYWPLDQVDSLDGSDMTEPVENVIQMLELLFPSNHNYRLDKQVFLNYPNFGDGNDPDVLVYDTMSQVARHMTFIGGISTCNISNDFLNTGNCRRLAYEGVSTTYETNVTLELRQLDLTQTNICVIYTLHQDYLIFTQQDVKWIK